MNRYVTLCIITVYVHKCVCFIVLHYSCCRKYTVKLLNNLFFVNESTKSSSETNLCMKFVVIFFQLDRYSRCIMILYHPR